MESIGGLGVVACKQGKGACKFAKNSEPSISRFCCEEERCARWFLNENPGESALDNFPKKALDLCYKSITVCGLLIGSGRILKWPTRADCKSAGETLHRFESCSYHHFFPRAGDVSPDHRFSRLGDSAGTGIEPKRFDGAKRRRPTEGSREAIFLRRSNPVPTTTFPFSWESIRESAPSSINGVSFSMAPSVFNCDASVFASALSCVTLYLPLISSRIGKPGRVGHLLSVKVDISPNLVLMLGSQRFQIPMDLVRLWYLEIEYTVMWIEILRPSR